MNNQRSQNVNFNVDIDSLKESSQNREVVTLPSYFREGEVVSGDDTDGYTVSCDGLSLPAVFGVSGALTLSPGDVVVLWFQTASPSPKILLAPNNGGTATTVGLTAAVPFFEG